MKCKNFLLQIGIEIKLQHLKKMFKLSTRQLQFFQPLHKK